MSSSVPAPLKVLVIDDEPLARDGLCASLAEDDDVEVLGDEVTRPQPATEAPADVEVLGDTVTRSLGALAADTGSSGATTLPRTGAGLLALAGIGAALAGIGGLVARLGRADRAA